MSYELRNLATKKDPTLESIEAWFDGQKKNPSGIDLLKIAHAATIQEIRDYLVERVINRKIKAKGWTDGMAAALTGKIEHFELAKKRDCDFTAGHPSPIKIAAQFGHLEFAKALLKEGVNASLSLIIAIQYNQIDFVLAMLKEGVDGSKENPGLGSKSPLSLAIQKDEHHLIEILLEAGAVNESSFNAAILKDDIELVNKLHKLGCEITPRVPRSARSKKMVEHLIKLGWDPVTMEPDPLNWYSWVSSGNDLESKKELLSTLINVGVPLNVSVLATVCYDFRPKRDLSVEILRPFIQACSDLNVKVDWDGTGEKYLIWGVLRDLSLDIVKEFISQGCTLPENVRIEDDWVERDEKRAWLAELGTELASITPNEFLQLKNPTKEEFFKFLTEYDGLFGVKIGMDRSVTETLGFKSYVSSFSQKFYLQFEGEKVSSLVYRYIGYDDHDGNDQMLTALVHKYGPSKGSNVLKWETPNGLYTLESIYIDEEGYTETTITLENKILQKNKAIDDLNEFQKLVEAELKNVAPDTIDSGSVDGVSVQKDKNGLSFEIKLSDGQGKTCSSFLSWNDLPLTENGNITEDLLSALIHASSEELRRLTNI